MKLLAFPKGVILTGEPCITYSSITGIGRLGIFDVKVREHLPHPERASGKNSNKFKDVHDADPKPGNRV